MWSVWNQICKFVIACRLRKHRRVHTSKFTKNCNYCRRKFCCTFEEWQCKFSHDLHKIDTVTPKYDKTIDKTGNTYNSISMSLETGANTTSFINSTTKSDNNCAESLNKSEFVDCISPVTKMYAV